MSEEFEALEEFLEEICKQLKRIADTLVKVEHQGVIMVGHAE